MEKAGAFAAVLEVVPADLAAAVTTAVSIHDRHRGRRGDRRAGACLAGHGRLTPARRRSSSSSTRTCARCSPERSRHGPRKWCPGSIRVQSTSTAEDAAGSPGPAVTPHQSGLRGRALRGATAEDCGRTHVRPGAIGRSPGQHGRSQHPKIAAPRAANSATRQPAPAAEPRQSPDRKHHPAHFGEKSLHGEGTPNRPSRSCGLNWRNMPDRLGQIGHPYPGVDLVPAVDREIGRPAPRPALRCAATGEHPRIPGDPVGQRDDLLGGLPVVGQHHDVDVQRGPGPAAAQNSRDGSGDHPGVGASAAACWAAEPSWDRQRERALFVRNQADSHNRSVSCPPPCRPPLPPSQHDRRRAPRPARRRLPTLPPDCRCPGSQYVPSSAAAASAPAGVTAAEHDIDTRLPTDMPSLDLVGRFHRRTPIVIMRPSLPVTGSVEIVGDAGLALTPTRSRRRPTPRCACGRSRRRGRPAPPTRTDRGVRSSRAALLPLDAVVNQAVVPLHLILRSWVCS